MRQHNLITAAALAILLLPGLAAAGNITDEPGYIDLEWIPIPSHAQEVQDIDLSAVLLSIAADADQAGDPALARALAMVRSIRVKAFSIDAQDVKAVDEAVEKVNGRLEKNDWKRLIYIKDKEQTVTVSTKRDDGDLVGLMVVVFEPEQEVAFINVVGDLDLGALFKLAQEFDSESFGKFLDEVDGKAGIKVRDVQID